MSTNWWSEQQKIRVRASWNHLSTWVYSIQHHLYGLFESDHHTNISTMLPSTKQMSAWLLPCHLWCSLIHFFKSVRSVIDYDGLIQWQCVLYGALNCELCSCGVVYFYTRIKALTRCRDSSIQPHPTYLSTLKICRVELCTELFYAIIPTFFYAFCWSAIPTSCYTFNVFILVRHFFFSSRCMLELKFAIYYRAESLPHRLPMQYWLRNHRLSSNILRTPIVFLIQ